MVLQRMSAIANPKLTPKGGGFALAYCSRMEQELYRVGRMSFALGLGHPSRFAIRPIGASVQSEVKTGRFPDVQNVGADCMHLRLEASIAIVPIARNESIPGSGTATALPASIPAFSTGIGPLCPMNALSIRK